MDPIVIVVAIALVLVIGGILIGSIFRRPSNKQAADYAAGSNKPDDRNAYGPNSEY
jgi:hypothetical protein